MKLFEATTIKLIFVLTFGIGMAVATAAFGGFSSTGSYILQSGADSSAVQPLASSQNRMVFSTIAPIVTGMSSGGTYQQVHGTHFTSDVYRLAGQKSIDRSFIPMAASENGQITTQVEFRALINGIPTEIGTNIANPTKWFFDWDTVTPIGDKATVVVEARAFDGRTWSPYKNTAQFTVDNSPPVFHQATISAVGLAANSQKGDVTIGWTATDNVSSTLYFTNKKTTNLITPRDISGLQLWLDAADSTSIVTGVGSRLAEWLDRSGNRRPAIQSTGTQQPTVVASAVAGKTVIRFDGVDDHLLLDLQTITNNRTTLFIVERRTASGANPVLRVTNGSDSPQLEVGYLSGTTFGSNALSTPLTGTVDALTSPITHVWTVAFNSSTGRTLRVDGGIIASDGMSTPFSTYGYATLGKSGLTAYTGDICEVIFYNRELERTERESVESYLSTKWQSPNNTFPRNISGLSLWLDATDRTTLETANGAVTKWKDRSGSRHHAIQATPSLRPTLVTSGLAGLNTIRFDGTDDHLQIPYSLLLNPNTMSLFVVALNRSAGGSAQAVLASRSSATSGGYQLLLDSANTVKFGAGNLTTPITGPVVSTNTAAVLSSVLDGTSYRLFNGHVIQGRITDSFQANSTTPLRLGAGASEGAVSSFLNGDIGEVLLYNRALTEIERQSVIAYLDAKWGIDYSTSWEEVQTGVAAASFKLSNVNDNTNYRSRMLVTDAAGNTGYGITPMTRTPDRTAPIISFSSLSGSEDIPWQSNIESHKNDTQSKGHDLRWTLTTNPNPNDSNHYGYILANTTLQQNANGKDTLHFTPSPNANTGVGSLDQILYDNIYARSPVSVAMRLTDREGNYADKDVRIHVYAVDDSPVIHSLISAPGQLTYDNLGRPKTNFFTLEDQNATTVNLDSFVTDVDTDKSRLTFTVTNNRYVALNISNASGHPITPVPDPDFYGDDRVTINVSDGTSVVQQSIIVRVWPVNDKPVIQNTIPSTLSVNEDIELLASLQPYENDKSNEDAPPTHNNTLKWTVDSVDSGFVQQITGGNGNADILTFRPVANKYGVTNVTVRLTDTDNVPKSVFPDYIPTPLYVTKNITLVWRPVNDAPVINSIIAQQVKNEDTPWVLDFNGLKEDPEDTGNRLKWTVITDTPNLVTINVETHNNRAFVSGRTNAFGRGNLIVTLTDSDDQINFAGYTPNPKSVQQVVPLKLLAVNDVPTIQLAAMSGAHGIRIDQVMSTDTITATATGFSDVGYTADTRNSAVMQDEYAADDPDLNHTKNSKLYNYKWIIDGVVTRNIVSTANTTDRLNVTPALEGKEVKVEISPFDGELTGSAVLKTIQVNVRPDIIASTTPEFDSWHNTNAMTVTWNAASDPDLALNNEVYYRFKVWRRAQWYDTPPTNVTLNDTTSFYDSGWLTNLKSITPANELFPDGSYYWSVWTANKFGPNAYDMRNIGWVQKFNLDTINPVMTATYQEIVNNTEISSPPSIFESAGKTHIIYGTKHTIESVWLKVFNTKIVNSVSVYTEQFFEIAPSNYTEVDETKIERWTYTITYETGTSTYNVYVRDKALNKATLTYTFKVVGDTTPPTDPVFDAGQFNLVDGVYEVVTSKDIFSVTGRKELNSAIVFNDLNVTGYRSSTFLTVFYPENPTGTLWATDQAGNKSREIPINIRFLMGLPTLNRVAMSRTAINSPTNPNINLLGLSSAQITEFTRATFSWTPQRKIISYRIRNTETNVSQTFTGPFTANTTVATVMLGNAAFFKEGANTLVLEAFDEANNMGSLTITANRLTQAPAVMIARFSGQDKTQNNSFSVSILGSYNTGDLIRVNGSTAGIVLLSNETWLWSTTGLPLRNTDVTVKVTDAAANSRTVTLWDHNDYVAGTYLVPYITGASSVGVVVDADPLPPGVAGVYARVVSVNATSDRVDTVRQSGVNALSIPTAAKSPNFKLDPKTKVIAYEIYAVDSLGSTVANADWTHTRINVGFPMPSSHSLSEGTVAVLGFNTKIRKWEWVATPTPSAFISNRVRQSIPEPGVYQAASVIPFAIDLKTVAVYPNPWVPNDANVENGNSSGIRFDNLTSSARIQIFTVSGDRVVDAQGNASWIWDGKNMQGNDVFSGVYLYVVTDGALSRSGKLTVIR